MNKQTMIIIFILCLNTFIAFSAFPPTPVGLSSINEISANEFYIQSSQSMNLSGGNYTMINLNTSQQTSSWTALVGNIRGFLGLGDKDNRSLYVWPISKIKGEIMVTRDNQNIDWSKIMCANETHIYQEEIDLGIASEDSDSINNTFKIKSHDAFVLSTVEFVANDCLSVNLQLYNQSDEIYFDEVLLYSGNSLLYTTLVQNNISSSASTVADFEIIVPNNVSNPNVNTDYYLYFELI